MVVGECVLFLGGGLGNGLGGDLNRGLGGLLGLA